MKKKIVILDSTAFYAGIPFTSLSKYYTTSSVLREVSHRRISRMVTATLMDTGRLVAKNPDNASLSFIRDLASKSGDLRRLSNTDLSVVALALQFKKEGFDAAVVSDDFSVENLAKHAGLEFKPVMTKGISRAVTWMVYCRGCGKIFDDKHVSICDVCGTPLKRRFK